MFNFSSHIQLKVEQNIKENVSHNGITCRTKYFGSHVFKTQTKGRNKCSLYLNAASVGVSCIYQLVNKVEQNIKENVSHNGITCRTKY